MFVLHSLPAAEGQHQGTQRHTAHWHQHVHDDQGSFAAPLVSILPVHTRIILVPPIFLG